MFKNFFYLLLLPFTSCETLFSNEFDSFLDWGNTNKVYYKNPQELREKFIIWKYNKNLVENHNVTENGFSIELNKFADSVWPLHYMKNHKLNNFKYDNDDFVCNDLYNSQLIPESIDWRDNNVVTRVKDQGQCGSCWAFSSTGSIESQYAIKTGNLVLLSESQIVDCDTNGTDMGCMGGFMDGAFNYTIKAGGLETEYDYPYVPMDESCTFNKSKIEVSIKGYNDVKGGENGLKHAVASVGPVSVAIDASNYDFQLYKEGVYYNPQCSQTMLDHAVLAVGYGTTSNGTDYWIVKNSWGDDWGMKGYIYMARNRNNSCGIATMPTYPLL